jgi:hypothetical protein
MSPDVLFFLTLATDTVAALSSSVLAHTCSDKSFPLLSPRTLCYLPVPFVPLLIVAISVVSPLRPASFGIALLVFSLILPMQPAFPRRVSRQRQRES